MRDVLVYRRWVCRPTYEILNAHASTLPTVLCLWGECVPQDTSTVKCHEYKLHGYLSIFDLQIV